jgi:drug/metabolite transporter (DMT)-like permease
MHILGGMNSANRVTLLVLCAVLVAGAVLVYRGVSRNSDSLTFGGWLITLAAIGIAAVWLIIGQNPLMRF